METDSGWDLSIDDRNGQLVLVVEVKRKINASAEWAAKLRQNILAHGTFPKAPYFLMVFPDRFYLWSNTDIHTNEGQPTYAIDASSILQPYFDRAGVPVDQISSDSLILVVMSWLAEILHSDQRPESIDKNQKWLIESGLYDALAGGKFEHEAAA